VVDQLLRDVENAFKENILESIYDILKLDERQARILIGFTSVTAYRRVHEITTSALDEIVKRVRSSPNELKRVSLLLARALVLIEYQEAREQITSSLATVLKRVIQQLIDDITKKRDVNVVVKDAEYARALLDAIAVLVYKYGR
jgi:CRISPR/Cas system CSM-associated protein Csm2 small subunit